mmetsp:Transcript_679/g.971  ORF Transcript_679/g.971 Transcript_679/m.971 type:complete len:85 (-) Transcript_679:372-626(-)
MYEAFSALVSIQYHLSKFRWGVCRAELFRTNMITNLRRSIKINQLQIAADANDVARGQISVNHASAMDMMQGSRNAQGIMADEM